MTETQYDPLGRVKKLIRQDGTSTSLIEYSGNAIRVTDDSGKKRLALADALGRLTNVCEVAAGNTRSPNEACGISGFTENGYVTTNTYDVLDNVTQTVQGTAAPQQQTRTMAYDGLGRITNARILEVSTTSDVTYGYDLDSNRTSVTDPRGAVNFEYDALHRLLRKKYGTTIVSEYIYDGTAANNAIGRLITDTDGGAGSGADKSDYTYDPMGRILTANRTVSATPYTIAYQYDYMGELTQLSYPSGRNVSYTYSSSAELTKVTDITSTNFDYVTGASYSPLGTLQQLNLANQMGNHPRLEQPGPADFDPHAEVRQRRASQSRLLLLRERTDSADHEQPGQFENGEVHLRRAEAAVGGKGAAGLMQLTTITPICTH